MAVTNTTPIMGNKLGYNEQIIRNVQASAKAVLRPEEYTYRALVLGTETKAYQNCLDALELAFMDLRAAIGRLPTLPNGQSVVELLDNGNVGLVDSVFAALPNLAMDMISRGDIYSTVLKAMKCQEKGLTDSDFTAPPKEGAGKSTAAKVAPRSLIAEDDEF